MPIINTPPLLLPSAILDTSFSGDGLNSIPLGVGNAEAQGIAVQADGKYVLAGWSDSGTSNDDFTLLRINVDGNLDTTFSGDGVQTTALTGNQKAYDLAIQTDGKIVVVGLSIDMSAGDFMVARYTSSGELDTSFSSDGFLTTSLSASAEQANAVAIQADGRILVAGTSGSKYALLRYNPDGSLDSSFDADGSYVGSFGTNTAAASAMALQADGKILVAGYGWNGSNWVPGVARHLATGALDASFSSDGKAFINYGGNSSYHPDIQSIAVQSDGKILLAGYIPGAVVGDILDYDAILIRLNPDGSTDSTFGDGDGIVTLNRSIKWDAFDSVMIEADGKILAAGNDANGLGNAVIARYNSDGTLDATFGNAGIFSGLYGNGTSTIAGLALTPNGQVVAAGASFNGANEFGVLRLAGAVGDQIALSDTPFVYTIPAATFYDADGDTLTLNASLAGGAPLPAWLAFDATTGTLSGTPTDGDFGTLRLEVTANDGAAQTSANFQLEVSTYFIEALRGANHARWNDNAPNGTSGTVITYSFMDAAPVYATVSESSTFAPMTDAEKLAVHAVLATYQEMVGLIFQEVSDSNEGGLLRFGTYNIGGNGEAAYAYFPGTLPASGDVWVNRSSSGYATPSVGTYAYKTLVHETGHALGLKHPGDYGDGDPPYLPTAEDNAQYTVMSYNITDTDTTRSGLHPDTPLLFDVAALQFLYGANQATRAGDDIYTFDPTALTQNTLWDGGGHDTIDLSNFVLACTLDLRAGEFSSITVPSQPSWEPPLGIDNVAIAYGVIIENALGGAGADTLIGNDADNTLDGGIGADTMTGGLGNDHYVVDSAHDRVSELAMQGIDSVHASVSWTLGANLENLILTGTANRSGAGNGLTNTLTGNDGNNLLNGGVGADILAGGTGHDTYVVDNIGDVIQENSGSPTEIDTILAAVNWTLGNNLENLTLTGSKNLNGTGNHLDNRLSGNGGTNELNGGGGNDILDGASGNDILTGGAGADTFAFTTPLNALRNVDTITDFVSGTDKIELSSAIYKAIGFSGAPGSDAFFHSGSTAQNTDDRVLYDQSNGALSYDADGSGALAAVQFALLSSAPTLLYTDFVVG